MSRLPEVRIILARCAEHRALFGMRLQREGVRWLVTWAFPVREGVAGREGYASAAIEGEFGLDAGYPGCPSCRAEGFVCCGACERVACWDSRAARVTCPWCASRMEVSGTITRLSGGSDL